MVQTNQLSWLQLFLNSRASFFLCCPYYTHMFPCSCVSYSYNFPQTCHTDSRKTEARFYFTIPRSMAVLGWWQERGCSDGFLVFSLATLSTGLLQGCMPSAFSHMFLFQLYDVGVLLLCFIAERSEGWRNCHLPRVSQLGST